MPKTMRRHRATLSCVLNLLWREAASQSCSGASQDLGKCSEHSDNATTALELGPAILGEIAGEGVTGWRETVLSEITAGYGLVSRLRLCLGQGPPISCNVNVDGPSIAASRFTQVVVKRFAPGSAASALEHERTLHSHTVELAFFDSFSSELLEKGLQIPKALYVHRDPESKRALVVMTDLSASYPLQGARAMSQAEIRGALTWLARLHAAFWEQPSAADRGLWSRGFFWRLDDVSSLQLQQLPRNWSNRYMDSGEWSRLYAARKALDSAVEPCSVLAAKHSHRPCRYRTLVHGDAKPANILCRTADDAGECAFVDFSWTGEGVGACDVVYLLWGVWTRPEIENYARFYHAMLTSLLPKGAASYSFETLWQYSEVCVLNLIRWMPGFASGEHFWAMPWSMEILRDVLDRLDNGQLLPEAAYEERFWQQFPAL
eukprot:TRINITY_DN74763_c0_g1_i1.p1 TRINITY_DN74763_c0_g1~~TRINITY_DN74763_c0_g1_i1.p1  ORF type:complete len:432 (-),score=48.36 TRINITY_DN74763_c0_g1_i1:159-1454(-)